MSESDGLWQHRHTQHVPYATTKNQLDDCGRSSTMSMRLQHGYNSRSMNCQSSSLATLQTTKAQYSLSPFFCTPQPRFQSHDLLLIIYPLTAWVVRAPQMISQPVSSIFPCPLGLGETQACPFPDVVSPPFLLPALSSSPFHFSWDHWAINLFYISVVETIIRLCTDMKYIITKAGITDKHRIWLQTK